MGGGFDCYIDKFDCYIESDRFKVINAFDFDISILKLKVVIK